MAKSKKQKALRAETSNAAKNNDMIDERFIAATTRPQFKSGRKFKKDKTVADSDDDVDGGNLIAGNANEAFGESLTAAIESDSRFAEALTNQEKFGCVPLMDKYGRKQKQKKKSKSDRRADNEDDGNAREMEIKSKENDFSVPEANDMESRIAYLTALSRGEISGSSSDDGSDEESGTEQPEDIDHESDDDSSASADVYGKAGVFDPSYNQLPGDAEDVEEDEDGFELTDAPTPYMAILNLDWTNIRAVDVYAMLQSFCPPGTLKKVEIYPSDFGKEMIEKERVQGPSGLWKKPKKQKKSKDAISESDDTSDSEVSEGDGSGSTDGNQSNDSAAVEADDGSTSDKDDDEEDIMNLNEATAMLYSHFPPQSEVTKNSRRNGGDSDEEGFDREKLRAYEAAKLRYYFAIATFSSSSAAESVYNNVDGMEMEHSAAEIDVRALPADEYLGTIDGRKLRDECDHLPGKYMPPDTVVTALRQSRVSCSWETGDAQRDKKLTRYGLGKDAWQAMAEGDDIKFYLASDHSSVDEESSGDNDTDEEVKGRKQTKQKAANMRSLLGLGESDDDDEIIDNGDSSDEDSRSASSSDQSKSYEKDESSTKQVTFIPGKGSLEEKIRSKIQNAADESELTPFQKYLEKRKQKRKERRDAARNKRRDSNDQDVDAAENDGMYEYDPEFGVAKFSDEESDVGEDDTVNDDFFLGEASKSEKQKKKNGKRSEKHLEKSEQKTSQASTKEELELLIAGDDDEENIKDYDMRGLSKLEKNAGKKLKGKRKRQLETLAANVSGQEFQIDATDDRFAALLDGTDDRFGIDRTNPLFKETGAMKTLLEEQTKRRKKNRGKKKDTPIQNDEANTEIINKSGGWVEKNSGAMALSSLVKSLQQKVNPRN